MGSEERHAVNAAGTLSIHSYDESHRRGSPIWCALMIAADWLQTVKMHIFCRKRLCFRPKTKKSRKQWNTFSSENEN